MAKEHRRFHGWVQCRKIVVIPSEVEESRHKSLKVTSTGSLAVARDDSIVAHHKLGIGSESLSTARRIAFHQRS
jgi:hypothetical protein